MVIRKLAKIGALIFFAGVLMAAISMKGVGYIVEQNTKEIVAPLLDADPEKTVLNIAQWSSDHYFDSKGKDSWFLKLSFVLSHRIIPSFVRMPIGAIEILRGGGACNELSSILELLLSAAGFHADQLDIVAPGNGHSVTAVKIGDDWIVVVTCSPEISSIIS